jgi:GDPmannose 4,6-dehydratase
LKKRALITGITGQDGSYLAELLLEKEYEVHGLIPRVALEDPEHRLWRIRHLIDRLNLHSASLESYPSVFKVVESVKPDECYHLEAQGFVSYSFEDEYSTIQTKVNGILFILSAIRFKAPHCRFYFGGSSEMFGNTVETPQNETTPFLPRSASGISETAGFHLTRNYREVYGLFALSGIPFNHESPRQGHEFVTRKISSHAAKIKLGLADKLKLGNLEAKRDWGHARDYVQAMWLMLQQNKPEDYVIATGACHAVRDFAREAFSLVGLDYRKFVEVDEKLYRPAEVNLLRGDASKALKQLGWKSTITFSELVKEMVETDLCNNSGLYDLTSAIITGA